MKNTLYLIKKNPSATGTVYVELNGMKTIFEISDVIDAVIEGTEVTYNVDDENLTELLESTPFNYISVDVNADDSGEHDVYEHSIVFENGEVTMDISGKHIKTYKRESSAIKFAESFGYKVKVI